MLRDTSHWSLYYEGDDKLRFDCLCVVNVLFSRVGVEPVGDDLAEWSEDAIRRFEQLALGKKLVAKPRGGANHSRSTNEETKISLELYDTSEGNEDLLIADVLVSEGLAKKIKES